MASLPSVPAVVASDGTVTPALVPGTTTGRSARSHLADPPLTRPRPGRGSWTNRLGPLGVGASLAAIWVAPGAPLTARLTLTIFVAAVVVWVATELDDTLVALVAAIAAIAVGGTGPERLFETLGASTVWLLIASFVIAAALTRVGLVDRVCVALVARARSIAGLFRLLAAGLGVTALIVPATSGRAALALPLFVGLSRAIGEPAVTRALALLFPTVILLSAAGSLLGAGAHVVTAETVARMVGSELDFARWLMLGAPFAIVSTALSTEVVLRLFLDPEQRRRPLTADTLASLTVRRAWSRPEALVAVCVGVLATTWATSGVHGLDATIVAVVGAVVVTLPAVGAVSLPDAVDGVPWNLVLFLAATLALGESLVSSGAGAWLADVVFGSLGRGVPAPLVLAVVVVTALGSHLVIGSRSARASVLTPLVVLVGTSTGVDPTALAFAAALGAGYCLTLTVSAKPVAMFAAASPDGGPAPYSSTDLLRLSAFLLPLHAVLLTVFALAIWPVLGLSLR